MTTQARRNTPRTIKYRITGDSTVTISPQADIPYAVHSDMGLLLRISPPWRKVWSRKTLLLPATADDVGKLHLALANVLVWAGYDDQTVVDTLSGWITLRREKWEKRFYPTGDVDCPYQYDPYQIGLLARKARRDVTGRMHRTTGKGARHGELKYKICAELARRPWKVWGPRELALKLRKGQAAVRSCLSQLAAKGEVRKVGRGKYQCLRDGGYVPYDLYMRYTGQDGGYDPEVPF